MRHLATDDPEEFLLRLAHVYRLELGCLVVGITGSIGKTTTKDVLAAVLAKRYRVWATKGNFNNLIGMPLTVLAAPADTEVLVLEMGMNHFHEIERLSQSANPNLAIVSKIGTSHIGILGSRENIARAKSEIVQGMCAAGDFSPLLVLGGEDDFTPFIRDTFAQPAGIDVMLAGVSDDDDFVHATFASTTMAIRSLRSTLVGATRSIPCWPFPACSPCPMPSRPPRSPIVWA